MPLSASYNFTCTVVIYIASTEYRFLVIRTKWLELSQISKEFWSDILKVYFGIYVY